MHVVRLNCSQSTITFYVSYYNFDTLKVMGTCETVALLTFSEEKDEMERKIPTFEGRGTE